MSDEKTNLFFFVGRPRFAIVIALLITIAGIVSYFGLPIALYPDLAPPSVQVSTAYPGANAETVAETVTTPLEQEINGAPGMIYMQSNSSSDGSMTINVYFDIGEDVDIAAVEVQNRTSIATSRLPEEVRREGLTIKKSSPNMLMALTLTSDNPDYDAVFLSNYISLNMKDALARIPGVGEASLMGARDYGMRIWLDPRRMGAMGLTPADVANVVRIQNAQIPAGRIGAPPSPDLQGFQFTLTAPGRLDTEEEFEDIILRVSEDGHILRLGDVARVELDAQNYDLVAKLDGKDAAMLAIYQAPGANALEVAENVRAYLDDQARRLPPGVELTVPFDTTDFINISIEEVQTTLLIAIVLVVGVVFLFLQDWRATLIPAAAVPVSLVGCFAVMTLLGFSINLLTLFGLILAIGIVVDDAIVVTETTTRILEEDPSISSRDAANQTMKEVQGPVIATTLVLLAVFVPVAFVPGMSGRMYNQFALTIAAAVSISSINALSLSPALASLILRPPPEEGTRLSRAFDRVYGPIQARYDAFLGKLLPRPQPAIVLYGGLVALLVVMFGLVPSAFVPIEDQGYYFGSVQLPSGASLARTERYLDELTKRTEDIPGVANVLTVGGYDMISGGAASNAGMLIVNLDHWNDRPGVELSPGTIMNKMMAAISDLDEAQVVPFDPPSIPGLGTTGGLEMQLQDLGEGDAQTLFGSTQEFMRQASATPEVGAAFSTYRADIPEIFLAMDRDQMNRAGVRQDQFSMSLSSYLGSYYINDFTKFGKVYRVMAQAEAESRSTIEQVMGLEIPSDFGGTVPVASFSRADVREGASTISRFNGMRAATVTANPAPGVSTGDAMDRLEQLADTTLPSTMTTSWSGTAYQERLASGGAASVLMLSFVVVYLFLVAQYESFNLPVAVMLLVPMGLLGAVVAQWIGGLPIDVYTQVGFFLLVGLAAKNAILIVEYAKELHEGGLAHEQAVHKASTMRFRAILMTSLTFLLGMLPMLVATGAGAASRRSLGTAVFGGMLAATIFSVSLVPVFYLLVTQPRSFLRFGRKKDAPES